MPDRLSSLWFVLAILRCVAALEEFRVVGHWKNFEWWAWHVGPRSRTHPQTHAHTMPVLLRPLTPPPSGGPSPHPLRPPPTTLPLPPSPPSGRSFTPSYTAMVSWDSERLLVRRETGQGMYRPAAWFAAKTLTLLPVSVAQTTTFAVIT